MLDNPSVWVKTFTEQSENAYDLSIAILVAAYSNDETAYKTARDKMQKAMDAENLPEFGKVDGTFNRFKIWLEGRMLVAAVVMNDEDQIYRKQTTLNLALRTQEVKTHEGLGLAFVTWGQSYYAMGLTGQKSIELNRAAIKGAQQLQGPNQLWAWVMIAQAASSAKDNQSYALTIDGLGLNQDDGIQKLYEKFPANDYRAWGFAALRLAAHDSKDEKLLAALKTPTEDAIEASSIEPDKMLATVYNVHASAKPKPNVTSN